MKNKMLCLITFVLMALMITGCSNALNSPSRLASVDVSQFSETNGLTLPISKDNVRLNVMISGKYENFGDTLFINALQEITGVKLDVTVSQGGSYTQKLKLLTASKQLPDIFLDALLEADRASLARNGAIANFDAHASELPNFKELFVDNKANRREIAGYLVDGNLYFAPGYNIARDVNHGYMYRKDIFDKHGIKPWTNTEEFYKALKKLKEIYPNSTPFVSKRQVGLISDMAPGWGINLEAGVSYTLDKNKDEFSYSPTMPEARELLDFLRKLYQEGLLDPEFLSCTEASWTSKVTRSDTGFVTFDWIDRMDLFYEQIKIDNPEYDLRFAEPIGPVGKYKRISKTGGTAIVVRNNDNALTSMKLVDFLLSPAGAKLATMGVLGESYEIVDNKVKYLGMEGAEVNILTLGEKYGLFASGLALRFDPKCAYFQYSPKLQDAQDLVKSKDLRLETPNLNISVSSEYPQYSEMYTEIDREWQVAASKYILSETDPTYIWAEWLEKAKSLGVEEIEKIYNQSYQNIKSSL